MKAHLARFLQNPSLAALPIIGMLIAAVVVAGIFGSVALHRGDEIAIERDGDMLVRTFASHAEQVARQEIPQVYWQEAVEKIRVRDYKWLKDNYGPYNNNVLGVRENHILDSADKPIYSTADGVMVDVSAFQRLASIAGPVVAEIRAFAPGTPARTGLIAETKTLADGSELTLLIAARLEKVAGRPSVLTVSTIIPDLDRSALKDEPPFLLVGVRDIDDEMLATIARNYGYAGLKWGEDVSDGRTTRALRDDQGNLVGMLSWIPERPSATFLRQMIPAILAALVALAIAAGIAILIARRFAMTLASEREKAWAASHDPLTGLANRRHFAEVLGRIHAEHQNAALPLALLSVDLDRFKELNDGFGHAVGDEALRLTARRIEDAVNNGHLVARVGGDEFQVVVTGEDVANVAAIAGRIIASVSQPMHVSSAVEARLGCSVGISIAARGEVTDLVRQADLAVSEAKTSGRNRYAFFHPAMEEGLRERIAIEHDLRAALRSGQLSVDYQPIFAAVERTVVGAEALVRWRHPTRGFVSPAQFIPIAESTGLVSEIGSFVLARACADAAGWDEVVVSVNVSAMQVLSPDLVERVRSVLRASGLPPARLELELTEAALVRDEDRAAATIAALRGLGVGVALDDIGTGYSSLAHIRRFAFSKLKIDKSLIDDMGVRPGASEIVFSIVNIARALGMAVTAEGVESEDQRRFLEAAGCNAMQGYLFSQAIPAPDFARFAGFAAPALTA